MTGAELKAERERRRMSQAEFGAWMADLLGHQRAYSGNEIGAIERAVRGRAVPAKFEAALLKEKLKEAVHGV